MDGFKELFKSKKFVSAILAVIVMCLEVSYFQGHPMLQEIVMSTMAMFGLQIAGQAHADANDDNYKSKKK